MHILVILSVLSGSVVYLSALPIMHILVVLSVLSGSVVILMLYENR